ncbi:MAG: beta-ketoacyl-ACP synthase II [Cytophagales bacterium]|nr:beta-ketoacyl-ACP synthase II [Bernardetiaceae bacterium]MDW8211263.1 beta-ketoacyl-ACP synthase II [Cytophagales bacterium]
MKLRRVVVTGLGAVTPIGNTVEEYWNGLSKGISGAGPITRFDASKFKTRFACEVKNFDPLVYLDKKEVRKYDLFAQFATAASDQAMADAAINMEKINPYRAGVIWGSGIGGINAIRDELHAFYLETQQNPRFNPFFITRMIIDICAGHISMKYGLRGPNFATVSACASASNAIADAFNYIRWNKADLIVTGGSEAAINECGIGGFNAMKALSERNDSPQTASRPFDKDRDGFVMGEGAACLILEELEHALNRGAKIYAEVAGAGMTADAYHITAPHPEGLGAETVMRNALEDAGISPHEVDYINVHGTSTPLGDVSEVLAIQKVFGEHAFKLNISSTKSMTGHLLGAAGAVEALACIYAIQHQNIPPTINHFTDDEQFDPRLNFTFNQAQQRSVNIALSNTFGFGGHNCSLIFKRYQP